MKINSKIKNWWIMEKKYFSIFWNWYSVISIIMLFFSIATIIVTSILSFNYNILQNEVAFTCIGVVTPVIFIPFLLSICNKIFYIRKILLSNNKLVKIDSPKNNLVDAEFLKKTAFRLSKKLITNKKTKPIAIMGNFGSGKSEFIKIVNLETKKYFKDKAHVYKFETLRYDDYNDPFMTLISFFISNEILNWKVSKKVLKLVVSSNTGFLSRFMRNESFSIVLQNIQNKILKTIEKYDDSKIKKIVVVDELDRTEPWFAYKVLEITSIYFHEVDSLRFVYALSDKPFREMLGKKYGKSENNRFLNKFIAASETIRLRVFDYLDFAKGQEREKKITPKELFGQHTMIQNCITRIGYSDEEFSYRRYKSLYEKVKLFEEHLVAGPFSEYIAFGLVVCEFGNGDFKNDLLKLKNEKVLEEPFDKSFTYIHKKSDYPIKEFGPGIIKIIQDVIENRKPSTYILENSVYRYVPTKRSYSTLVGEFDNVKNKIDEWNSILSSIDKVSDYGYKPILEEKERINNYISKQIDLLKNELKVLKNKYKKLSVSKKVHFRLLEVKKWI